MNSQTKIKELREQNGLSQEELSETSGISLRTIQRIENGESVPRGSTLKTIATSLNVSSDLLINAPEEITTIETNTDISRTRGFRFPWYIFGFTIIGASWGFLIGLNLVLNKILPDSEFGGMTVFSLAILTGAIGMVTGKYVESKNN